MVASASVAAVLPACGTKFQAAPDRGMSGSAGSAGDAEPSGGTASGTGGTSSGGSAGTAGTAGGGGAFPGGGGEGGSVGGATGEGGSDGPGAGGEGGDGNASSCDPNALSEGCTLTEDAGIFVSPDGDDDADGSRTQPLQSLGEALERARDASQPRPIFVCSADYDEHLSIRSDGVALHGGFACPEDTSGAWIYDSAERARVVPTSAGPALRVRDVEGLTLSNLVLRARDATDPDESSVTAFVSGSSQVIFENVQLIAGRGSDGSASTVDPFEYGAPEALAGNAASGATGGAQKNCTCDSPNPTRGGRGGDGGITATAGQGGHPMDRGGGAPGQAQVCSSGGAGEKGEDAPSGADGSGASAPGAVTSSGWVPESGDPGEDGLPGQGGGGGGGNVGVGIGGGGSGGCGGCGGRGAEGGRGGGASIGLVSLDSVIELRSSSIETDRAGHGGAGGGGQVGQPGGAGGEPMSPGCSGGAGGNGADGAKSGGGAGGSSVGIVWRGGEEPALANTTIEFDEAGEGGLGGNPGENDGIAGISRRIYAAE